MTISAYSKQLLILLTNCPLSIWIIPAFSSMSPSSTSTWNNIKNLIDSSISYSLFIMRPSGTPLTKMRFKLKWSGLTTGKLFSKSITDRTTIFYDWSRHSSISKWTRWIKWITKWNKLTNNYLISVPSTSTLCLSNFRYLKIWFLSLIWNVWSNICWIISIIDRPSKRHYFWPEPRRSSVAI